ncbi:MAG: hypothetical protein JWP03_4626, partial [Phycisphaerales bacterium]|nr:hypothetical protein [Phycisphaerales bacterium]MDB5329774.1 hypothetical protein [Phycisphaerales bacterium]MDB5333475.1 hypothetical protein [Phycisphaerales bacterium]
PVLLILREYDIDELRAMTQAVFPDLLPPPPAGGGVVV